MANYLLPGTQLYVYILRSITPNGTFIEGVYTNKTQAEAVQRALQQEDTSCCVAILERVTEPHEV